MILFAGLLTAGVERLAVAFVVAGSVGPLRKLLKISPTTSDDSDALVAPFMVDDNDEDDDDGAEVGLGEQSPSKSAEPDEAADATATAAGTVLDDLGLCVGLFSAIGTGDFAMVVFLSVGSAESNVYG